jgi:hypothetical protein
MQDSLKILNLEEMAIHYQSQGLRVFPLLPGDKRPYGKGSKGHYFYMIAKERISTVDEIRDFWGMNPTANIGLFSGPKSGVSVLDIDVSEDADGFKTLKNEGMDFLIDVGLKIHTPTNGMHLMFKYTPTIPGYGNESKTFGLDFRNSNKGHSLLPPSSAVPKYDKDGNTFVEYGFEGIEPYEFQKDLLPEFPEIPNPDFFHQINGSAGKRKNSNVKKRPYAGLTSTYLPPGNFRAKTAWPKETVAKNLRREKNKNALRGQLGNSKIVQFTDNQKKLQKLASEQGDVYEGEKPLTIKQVKKAANGMVKRMKKQRFLILEPSKPCNFTRVYFNYVFDRTKYWVLLNFKNKFETDGMLPDLWTSPETNVIFVRYNDDMVSLNLKEKYPLDLYIGKNIPVPNGRF